MAQHPASTYSFAGGRSINVEIRLVAPSAIEFDRFMGDLKHGIKRLANEASRQKRNNVAVMSVEVD